jgi:hypothetical protein
VASIKARDERTVDVKEAVSQARVQEVIRSINGIAEAAGAEYNRLVNDPKLREELGL